MPQGKLIAVGGWMPRTATRTHSKSDSASSTRKIEAEVKPLERGADGDTSRGFDQPEFCKRRKKTWRAHERNSNRRSTGTTLVVLVGLGIAFLLFMAFLNVVKSGNLSTNRTCSMRR